MIKQRLLCLIASLVVSACFASSVSQTISQQNETTGSGVQLVGEEYEPRVDINQSRLLTLVINPESNQQQQGASVVELLNLNSNSNRLLEIENYQSQSTSGQTQKVITNRISGNSEAQSQSSGGREARKMNLFQGMWRKPKVSPLYLINGTVCRFVDAVPICTTLSTNGLICKYIQQATFSNE